MQFDLSAQPLGEALKAVASQTNTNVLFKEQVVAGQTAPPLKAQLSSGGWRGKYNYLL